MAKLFTLGQIADLVGIKTSKDFKPDAQILRFIIDSREAQAGDFFIPLKGEHTDGHKYIQSALEKGAIGFITSDSKYLKFPNGILVEDTLSALEEIAKYRAKFPKFKIAITGSAGKTTTKELMALVLEDAGNVYKNPGNYNNEIGLPLTLANMPENTDYAVLEMGTSALGEIAHLVDIAKPDISVLLTVSYAHTQYLGSLQNVIKAKGEIFNNTKNIVLPLELVKYYPESKNKNVLTFGYKNPADIVIKKVYVDSKGTHGKLYIRPADTSLDLYVPIYNKHIFENISAIAGVLLHLNLDPKKYLPKVASYKGYDKRGKIYTRKINKSKVIIVDYTYNSNPLSLQNLFESTLPLKAPKVYVIGDMLELGKFEKPKHEEIIDYFLQGRTDLDYLFLYGNLTKYAYKKALDKKLKNIFYFPFDSKQELKKQVWDKVRDLANNHHLLYLIAQGSRGMRLEEVVRD